ncbi:MAG: tyrosine--tRNA ligase [Candidatus Dormibacteraeota bacterium]|nr:tyrosine--tRNA ligase [Candidatus Dormibacteraeota bacterium]
MSEVESPTAASELLLGVVDCVNRVRLEARLNTGSPLRIKFGVDPSAPDIHLGHTVPMRLLRRWQRMGHLPVLVIGDYTARIGDPTGRSDTRPQLGQEQVESNAKTYLDQLFKVVDSSRVEVRHQSEWFDSFSLDRMLSLARTATVAQLLQRADFEQRMRAEQPIGVHELFYPLLQGYDSVAVRADVELGGTDQLFNLLCGREVQVAYNQPAQDIITVPLLVGLDGERKMSKSLGNAVAVADPPGQQFGQLMSLPDRLVLPYLELLTDVTKEELARVRQGLQDGTIHPRALKAHMAETVVAQLHGKAAARAASLEFDRIFRDHQLPAEMEEVAVGEGPQDVRDLLLKAGLATSRSEAARLVTQGGVRLDGVRVSGWQDPVAVSDGAVIRVGPRRMKRLRAS